MERERAELLRVRATLEMESERRLAEVRKIAEDAEGERRRAGAAEEAASRRADEALCEAQALQTKLRDAEARAEAASLAPGDDFRLLEESSRAVLDDCRALQARVRELEQELAYERTHGESQAARAATGTLRADLAEYIAGSGAQVGELQRELARERQAREEAERGQEAAAVDAAKLRADAAQLQADRAAEQRARESAERAQRESSADVERLRAEHAQLARDKASLEQARAATLEVASPHYNSACQIADRNPKL